MNVLDQYWEAYDSAGETSDLCIGTSSGGYTCYKCGQWVYPGCDHYCPTYYRTNWIWPPTPPNPTEQAFKILKKLVEEKVVKEPASFKKFCDLIEKIAKVL